MRVVRCCCFHRDSNPGLLATRLPWLEQGCTPVSLPATQIHTGSLGLYPEAFELVTGVPAEDLPAHVLIVHPLKKKISAEPP